MDKKSGCTVTNACGTEKKKGCCEKIFQGAFVGGVVMFVYFAISWMYLPWHAHALQGFKNEKAVAKALADNATGSGVYVLPYMKDGGKPAVDKPFAFVNVKVNGVDTAKVMHTAIERELVLCIFLAGLLSCLLTMQGCGCPIGFSMKVGLFAALAHNIPDLIWWHYPSNFTFISMADDFLSVTLAGLAISKIVMGCNSAKMKCGCTPGQCKCGGGKGSCGA